MSDIDPRDHCVHEFRGGRCILCGRSELASIWEGDVREERTQTARPRKAQIVFTLELDGSVTREEFGDPSSIEHLKRRIN